MRKATTTTMPATVKFGALAPEAIERIEDTSAVHDASAAHYKMETRMQSLRRQYDAEAAKIRREYLQEIGAVDGSAGDIE
jgi:hypothetical protein